MGHSNRRGAPSSPEEIMAAAAARRAAERQALKDPGAWGVSAQILQLPTSANVNIVVGDRDGNRDKILAANRSDAFDLLHQAGSLTDAQHLAARRLFRAWCLRAGVRDRERPGLELEKIDGGRRDPSSMVTDAMVDAGRMIEFILRGVGPVSGRVLSELIGPMVDQGRVCVWRVQVQGATGETERHAQGAAVRIACEDLRLVLDDWDAEVRAGLRRAAA